MTAFEEDRSPTCGHGDGMHFSAPPPRLGVRDALSICVAMVEDDRSLRLAATRMWHSLAPFVPALTQAEAQVGLAVLEALAGNDARTEIREIRRRAARRGLADVAAVLEDWLARTGAPSTD
jgi:hypothetical protein